MSESDYLIIRIIIKINIDFVKSLTLLTKCKRTKQKILKLY